MFVFFFFSSRRRHTRFKCDWSSDVCSSDLLRLGMDQHPVVVPVQGLAPRLGEADLMGGAEPELLGDAVHAARRSTPRPPPRARSPSGRESAFPASPAAPAG